MILQGGKRNKKESLGGVKKRRNIYYGETMKDQNMMHIGWPERNGV